MKSFVFWLTFPSSLSLSVELTIGLDNGLAPNKRQAIILINADLIHWRIYVALGGDELKDTVFIWSWKFKSVRFIY